MSASEVEGSQLAPSKLGTKEHWDNVYDREVKVFKELGDEGEVWFGESSADDMVEWVSENLPSSVSILDVGCGNGDLLFRLHDAEYENLFGIDYSPASITLARSIAHKRCPALVEAFEVRDIISTPAGLEKDKWGCVCDKGTYDAICLSDEEVEVEGGRRKLMELYPERVADLVAKDGIFLITSCNWTKTELEKAFINSQTGFKYHSHIPRSSFTFGGATGQTITTVAFVKS
ncbi:S-adenosyl-L-methionine-dependent methyltransferase [Meredithblackwellia eburnea MCA 4105]